MPLWPAPPGMQGTGEPFAVVQVRCHGAWSRELCREAKWRHSGHIVKTGGGRQYFRKTATPAGAVPMLGNVPSPLYQKHKEESPSRGSLVAALPDRIRPQ